MPKIKVSLPNPDSWPLRIFLFARWNRDTAPPVTTVASWKDLKYYLRVMRGPNWRMTAPLCVQTATAPDVEMLETALAYMETSFCARWFYPMEAWTPTRVLLIAVHAWASGDPRLQLFDWQGRRDLIPHVTPYVRYPETYDMGPTVAGLARLAKEFFPLEIFHYRKIYYREHRMAVGRMFDLATWRDASTPCDAIDLEDAERDGSAGGNGDELGRCEACDSADAYDSDIHQAEDPRESVSISVTARTLPYLCSDGILLQIPSPTPPS